MWVASGFVAAVLALGIVAWLSRRDSLSKVTTPSIQALQLYSRADLLIKEGNSAAAEDLLRQAIAADPEFASAHTHLAYAIHNQGRPREEFLPPAETAFRLSDRTTERERYFIRGSYFDLRGEWDAAIAEYEALLSFYPDHFWGPHNLLRLYEAQGRDVESAQCAVRIAQLRPKDFEASVQATWYLTRSEPDSALTISFVGRSLQLVTPDILREFTGEVAWLRLRAAYERWLEGDAAGALGVATGIQKEVETIDTPQDGAFVELGGFFQSLGRLDAAEELFQRVSGPTNVLVALSLLRDDPRQLDLLTRTAVVHPNSADPYIVIAMSRAGLVDRAERALEEKERGSLLTRPGILQALRGEIALARGRTTEAVDHFRASLEETRLRGQPGHWLCRESLSAALASQGDLEGSIRVLEDGSVWKRHAAFHWVSQGAFWTRNQLHLARRYRQAGRPEDARQIEEELSRMLALADPDHPTLLELRRQRSS